MRHSRSSTLDAPGLWGRAIWPAVLLAGLVACSGGDNDTPDANMMVDAGHVDASDPDASGPDASTSDPPTATIVFPPHQSVTDASSVIVRGTASDEEGIASVHVNGVLATTTDGYQTWQADVPLAVRDNTLVVETVDDTGARDPDAVEIAVYRESVIVTLPSAMIADPDTQRTYILDRSTYTMFEIDPADQVSVMASETVGTGTYVRGSSLTIDQANDIMWVLDWGTRGLYNIDMNTGDRTFATYVGGFTHGVLMDSARDRLLLVKGSDEHGVYVIDLETYALTPLSNANTGAGPVMDASGLATIDSSGDRVFIVDTTQKALYRIDLITGDRTIVTSATIGSGPELLNPSYVVFDKVGDRVLLIDAERIAVIAVDVATGARTIISDANVGAGAPMISPGRIAWTGTRALVVDYADGLRKIWSIDTTTGDRTLFSGHRQATGEALRKPESLALDTDNRRVFVGDWITDTMYGVDLDTGDRTILSSAELGTGDNMAWLQTLIADLPNGRVLAVSSEDWDDDDWFNDMFVIDLATGDRTEIPYSQRMDGIMASAYDRDNERMLISSTAYNDGFDHSELYWHDLTTGDITALPIGMGTSIWDPVELVLDTAQNRTLLADYAQEAILDVNLTTGDAVTLSGASAGAGPLLTRLSSMDVDLASNTAWVTDRIEGVVSIDLASGDRQSVSSAGVGRGPLLRDPGALRVDVASGIGWVADVDLGALFTVDLVTGERVLLSH